MKSWYLIFCLFSSQIEGRTLLRLVNNEAIFTVALPAPGLYYFSVYTGDYWRSECLESAASFLINCPEMPGSTSPPYPPVPFFGPTPVMETLGIQPSSHADPLVVCNSDMIEVGMFGVVQSEGEVIVKGTNC